ncbi:cytochrome P450 [uncultured Friedmanniella sp.]|uniref:cytochrome P450 n=1 Tax=uncultured Friedmanniella sp. TaxID=335381 RepID=UPI0035C9D420
MLRSRDFGRTFTPREPAEPWAAFNALHVDALLENEPPRHTRLRRLVAGAFSRGHVTRLQPRIAALAEQLLTDCAGVLEREGAVDVMAHYAEPLPVLVIAELLGWPAEGRHRLRPWSQAIVRMYEVDRSAADEAAAQQASREFAAAVDALASERSRRPGEDLLSDLVAVREDGDRLSADELVATAVLLLNAGHEASVNGFGNGLASLLGSGRAVPAGGTAPLVEEMLRHDSPLQLFERTASVDVVVEGVRVRAGERVAALLGAANRDSSVFDEPNEFRPDRRPNPQLGFGAGIHFCVGAPLARLELATSIETLLRRWPRLELVEAVRRPTFVLRGYERLALRPIPTLT